MTGVLRKLHPDDLFAFSAYLWIARWNEDPKINGSTWAEQREKFLTSGAENTDDDISEETAKIVQDASASYKPPRLSDVDTSSPEFMAKVKAHIERMAAGKKAKSSTNFEDTLARSNAVESLAMVGAKKPTARRYCGRSDKRSVKPLR